MNKFMNGLQAENNFGYTENGAVKYNSTMSKLLDMFAMGGAYRQRSDEDCILLFKNAFDENPSYALKCLFYIRDVRGGQGERRFFRVCMKYMAEHAATREAARRNLKYVAEYGRWDDLYVFVGTPLEKDALQILRDQLELDVECKTPSLLAKWLKSENTSSKESQRLATITRKYFGLTPRQYRKTLSILRERINVLERLMSAGEWDKIEFDKIPSKAGLKYKNAFARHDIERAKANAVSYKDFIADENTKVNAKTLYPYEVVQKALQVQNYSLDFTDRLAVNKYWANLEDYFRGKSLNALAVVDTSGSMTWTANNGAKPIDVAISLGIYCAERAKGPFAGHYISFSSRPQLIRVEGADFVDKVKRIYRTNLCENTNIEATFDMLLTTAIKNRCSQSDLPDQIIIVTDMEFDQSYGYYHSSNKETLMESISKKWRDYGYKVPDLLFWNVNARTNNIPMAPQNGISFISGFSPSIFEQVMSRKSAFDLMYEVLDKERYACIH